MDATGPISERSENGPSLGARTVDEVVKERTRGRLKAWRRDIDDQYHLHYWQDGEAVELARVVVHNDFRIK